VQGRFSLRFMRTLRAKLALAFSLITILSIVLVGVMALYLLRDREIAAATQRTGDLLPPVTKDVSQMAQQADGPDYIAAYLRQTAKQLNVRFILLDESSDVIVDTDGKQSGHFTMADNGKNVRGMPNSYRVAGYQEGPTQWYAFMQSPYQIGIVGQRTMIPRTYQLLMLVPKATITSAWEDLAPRLIVAGLAALVVSLAVALLIARTITRPIKRITQASERMAHGDYGQQIPVDGPDEVARLAASFNGMARQVANSHQMMRDLLANVAHELKTPLTSIQGFSLALSDGALQTPEEYANAARIITEESERMRRLVNDLLLLSQIESGQATLDRQPLSVSSLLRAAEERLHWRAVEQQVSVNVAAPETLPPVLADSVRIEQVLANLLDNALRHTPSSGAITLLAASDGGEVRIAIHNTGSYISPDHLDRVFERFYQVDRSRRRNGHNGGLGLSIAREIVAAHGGRISASSDANSGTTFAFTLPIAQETVAGQPSALLPLPAA
jgi:signal transduction histidine kinase